uniref:Uncharacterized protein n=1 Tax=Oryza nivara TaxID=4536 RepID=A0A0E0IRA6_ORYNI
MGEFEDGDPDSGEVSDLHGIAPAVDDPRLPIDDPREHALVFGDPGLDEPRHGGLTAHNLRAIADRASGLDAIGHDTSATSLSSSSTTQRPPTTLAHDRCTPPHRRSHLAATSPGLSLAVAELRQAAASPGPSLAIAKLRQAVAVLSRCCGGRSTCRLLVVAYYSKEMEVGTWNTKLQLIFLQIEGSMRTKHSAAQHKDLMQLPRYTPEWITPQLCRSVLISSRFPATSALS